MKECVNEGIFFDGVRTSFLVFSVGFGVFVVSCVVAGNWNLSDIYREEMR